MLRIADRVGPGAGSARRSRRGGSGGGHAARGSRPRAEGPCRSRVRSRPRRRSVRPEDAHGDPGLDWQAAKELDATGYLTPIEAETLAAVGQETSGTADAEIDVPVDREPVETATESAETTARIPHFPMCSAATSEGAKCWISLTGPPDCDFHVGRYRYLFRVQYEDYYGVSPALYRWSGECRDGAAHGHGTLYHYQGGYGGMHTGEFVNGVKQGYWVLDEDDEHLRQEGHYVDGVKQGYWIESGGNVQGDYVDGRRHGTWGFSNDGEVSYREYRHGERID